MSSDHNFRSSYGREDDEIDIDNSSVERLNLLASHILLGRDSCVDVRDFHTENAFKALPDDVICDVTGFTGREKKALWASWKKMTRDDEDYANFGRSIVSWMSEYVPGIAERLPADDDDNDGERAEADSDKDSKMSTKFSRHVEDLIKELHAIVTLLPTPEQLTDRINTLADSHVGLTPRVGKEYFGPFQDNFNMFVGLRLGLPVNSHVVMLWDSLMGMIYTAVDIRETEVLAEEEQKKLLERTSVPTEKEEEEKSGVFSCCFPIKTSSSPA